MSIHVFPEELRANAEAGSSYVSFQFIKKNDPNTLGTVYLYLPPGFTLGDSASFGNLDLGVIGGLGSKNNKSEQLTQGDRDDIATFAAAKGASNFGAEAIFAKEKIEQGTALNPNTVLQFDNVGVRSFNFSFKMVAESAAEANNALQIENLFRFALYPELKGNKGLFLEYPYIVKVKFHYGSSQNSYMPKLQECYITGLNVTYNASSNMYHADGSPTEIDLELSLQETKAMTKNDLFDIAVRDESTTVGQAKDAIIKKLNNKANAGGLVAGVREKLGRLI